MTYREALRKRLSEATPGPWAWRLGSLLADWGKRFVVVTASSHNRTPYLTTRESASGLLMEIKGDEPDMEFIAHARTDVETLLALVEKMEGALKDVASTHAFQVVRDALTEARTILDGPVR